MPRGPTAFAAKALPSPCVPTAFAAEAVPFASCARSEAANDYDAARRSAPPQRQPPRMSEQDEMAAYEQQRQPPGRGRGRGRGAGGKPARQPPPSRPQQSNYYRDDERDAYAPHSSQDSNQSDRPIWLENGGQQQQQQQQQEYDQPRQQPQQQQHRRQQPQRKGKGKGKGQQRQPPPRDEPADRGYGGGGGDSGQDAYDPPIRSSQASAAGGFNGGGRDNGMGGVPEFAGGASGPTAGGGGNGMGGVPEYAGGGSSMGSSPPVDQPTEYAESQVHRVACR